MTDLNAERVTTLRSKSGEVIMRIVRSDGQSAESAFDTHASAFEKIEWVREQFSVQKAGS